MKTFGEHLKNGARVLAYKPSEKHKDSYIVLCEWNGDFVTWIVDKNGNAVWGNYFSGKAIEAAEDYKARA